MDKDRIVGSAKDFAGKVEGAVGSMTGDAKTQAEGRAREAAGTVQNLYGQAKDAAGDVADAAVNYAKIPFAAVRRRWRRPCRTIRSVPCWSPVELDLRSRCS
jgi:uncharacterized protein YjbJ (UPF0337 family)